MANSQDKSLLPDHLQKKLWLIASKPPVNSEFLIVPKWKEPIDNSNIFSKDFHSYCLELGSGWGEVGISLALENPNTGFILMEKKRERIQETIQQILKNKITNIKILSVNINWFLENLFLPNSFDQIILNFPDPWPKKKHWKNRTISKKFIQIIFTLLKQNGQFLFATDYGPYARRAISTFRKMEDLFSFQKEYSFDRENFPLSKFELMKKKDAKRIYYLNRIKKS